MSDTILKNVTRDERQEECRIKWIKNKCKGTIVAGTGFGKTWTAIKCLQSVLAKYPNKKIIVVVPTEPLLEQWRGYINSNRLLKANCQVLIINTAVKHKYKCDILVIDEIHRVASEVFRGIFKAVNYKYILGLTATFERLDGKHELLKQYCPVIDEITLLDAQANGWVAPYKEYKVILDVDDIDTYNELNKEFTEHFEFFDFDWDKAQSCLGKDGFKYRAQLRDEMCPFQLENESYAEFESRRKRTFTLITHHATQFMRIVHARKAFINNHPKKIEIAQKIIAARPNSKIIVFSNNIKMAESVGMGSKVYSGKDSKKKGRTTIKEFSELDSGVLSTIKKADEGLDVPGLSVAIIIGLDSSKIKKTQRIGRVIRKEGAKQAEIFTIIINDTVELEWFNKSNSSSSIIPIGEEGLNDVLEGKNPRIYTQSIKNFTFRF